ncbi:hypothetical protein BC831DRAFT_435896 [Entophlyctis helioformis]|nr:hypothetical protein BC831DRAFT_435896 [Entophlyctis helioformis]
MLPAPKAAKSGRRHDEDRPRMLGQGSGDGSQSFLAISRPISRKTVAASAKTTTTTTTTAAAPPQPSGSGSGSRSADAPKATPAKDVVDDDDMDPDSYFTLDLGDSRPPRPSAASQPAQGSDDDEDEEDEDDEIEEDTRQQPVSEDYEAYAAQYAAYYGTAYADGGAYAYDQPAQGADASSSAALDGLDAEAMAKLRGRGKAAGPVEIKDISRRDQFGAMTPGAIAERNASLIGLSGSSSFSASASLHAEAKLRGAMPSLNMKRKHNIMSLAFEARSRQESIDEEAANRRMTQKIARAKYGF